MKKFSIGDAVSFGWQGITKDFWFFVGLGLVYSILSGLLFPIGWLLGVWMIAGFIKITLAYYSNKKLPFADLFSETKKFGDILIAQLLVGLIVFGGLLLLIIPGIYWALKYQFVVYLIVDKDLSFSEAMQQSGELTRGIKWHLLWMNIVFGLICILGFMALGVGILVAIPIIWLAKAHVYKQLSM